MDKNALIDAYIHHRNLLNKGRGELSWLAEILKIFGVAGAVAYGDIIRTQAFLLVLGAIFYIGFCYFVGWWWEEKRYFRNESAWGNANARNDIAEDIREIKYRMTLDKK